jgi:hypothetical protein
MTPEATKGSFARTATLPQPELETSGNQPSDLSAEQKKVDELLSANSGMSADKITDEIFYQRYPDLKGQKLTQDDSLTNEWKQIKSDIVQPRIDQATQNSKATAAPNNAQQSSSNSAAVATETKGMLDVGAGLKRLSLENAMNSAASLRDSVYQKADGWYNWMTGNTPQTPTPVAPGTSEVKSTDQPKQPDMTATTDWNLTKLHSESADNAKTDEMFFKEHPDLVGKKLNSDQAQEWKKMNREIVQNKYNQTLEEGVKEFPSLEPKVLKSLLVTESNFDPGVTNSWGFAGIAQFGKPAAKTSGLTVNDTVDERLDPEKAIPAAARHLKDKSEKLEDMAFSKYGKPEGDEYWKFVTASYNGGEDCIAKAMETAYNNALTDAKAKGMDEQASVEYAKSFATKWDNLLQPEDDFKKSPLYAGTKQEFPSIADGKYGEIGDYPVKIMTLAREGELIQSRPPIGG